MLLICAIRILFLLLLFLLQLLLLYLRELESKTNTWERNRSQGSDAMLGLLQIDIMTR